MHVLVAMELASLRATHAGVILIWMSQMNVVLVRHICAVYVRDTASTLILWLLQGMISHLSTIIWKQGRRIESRGTTLLLLQMEQIQCVVWHRVVTGILDITVVVGVGWRIVWVRVDEVVGHNCHLLSLLGSVLLIPVPLALLLVLFLLLLFVFLLALTDSRLLPVQILLTVLVFVFCNVRWIRIRFNTVFCNFTFLAFLGLIHVTPFVM